MQDNDLKIVVAYEVHTEEQWSGAEDKIISIGTPVLYEYIDAKNNSKYYKMKVGDGQTKVSLLPFIAGDESAQQFTNNINIGNNTIDSLIQEPFAILVGTDNTTHSRETATFGRGNLVGQRAFKFIEWVNSADGTDSTLKVEDTSNISVGDIISIKGVYQYYNFATVTSKDNELVYINQVKPSNENNTTEGYFWMIDKPSLGEVDIGYTATAFGYNNKALYQSHAEGYGNEAIGRFSHAEGQDNVTFYCAHAEGKNNKATGEYSHAEGNECESSGDFSHASGQRTIASGEHSHTEGYETKATNKKAHAEGYRTTASGQQSHSEGNTTMALGDASHAEGENTRTVSNNSHAEGLRTRAYGHSSHIEGMSTTNYNGGTDEIDSSYNTWKAGQETKNYFFARAVGEASHVEGKNCFSGGVAAHTEGECNAANGNGSHAEGYMVRAMSPYQHVQGKWNVEDNAEKYAHIVGNGTKGNRSNAHTIDWDGNAWFAGSIEASSIILNSNGKRYKLTINNGQLAINEI